MSAVTRATMPMAIVAVIVLAGCGVRSGEGSADLRPGVGESTTSAPTSDPASTGSGIEEDPLAVGQSGTVGDWEVTVTEIVPDATDEVLALDSLNGPPAEGNQYVLVTLDATNTGDIEGVASSELLVTLIGSDAEEYNDLECSAFVEDFDLPLVDPGEVGAAKACLEAPPAAIDGGVVSVELAYESEGEPRVYWALP